MIGCDETAPEIRPADQTVPGLRAAVRVAQEVGARLGERQILFGPMPHAQTRIVAADADVFGRLNFDTSPGCDRLCSPMDQHQPGSAASTSRGCAACARIAEEFGVRVEEIPIRGGERTRFRA